MRRESSKEKATRLYAFLLTLYPQGYKYAFGPQMVQTFKDYYADVVESGQQAEVPFWFGVVSDEVRGILREQLAVLKESTSMNNVWIKQGILFGILLGIIHIGYNLINNLAPANLTLNSLLNNSILLIVAIFTSVAGYIAVRKTGQLKMGTYAGLCTGLLSIGIGISALFLITFAFMSIIRQNAFMIFDFHRSGLSSIDEFIIQDAVGATIVGITFSLLAGGICGTFGGYLGKIVKGRENDE
ncbi:MAG TPA: hypothetical protein VF458_07125 [Ktedonobacteraceae bacterium]